MPHSGSGAGRVNSWGVALFGGGLISGIAALISGVAAYYSQERATAAANSARKADTNLQEYRGERQDQFVIYERVEKQLANNNATGIILAASYVALIENSEVKKNLCRVIDIIMEVRWESLSDEERVQYRTAFRDIGVQMQVCVSRALEKIVLEQTQPKSPLPSPSSSDQTRRANTTLTDEGPGGSASTGSIGFSRIVNSGPANLKGWDIDVFWCQAQGEPSRLLAQKVATKLGELANNSGSLAGQQLGQVRLRSVTKLGEAKMRMFKGNSVVGSADEAEIATALSNWLAGDASLQAQFPFRQTATLTRWYVSVFTCGFPEV